MESKAEPSDDAVQRVRVGITGLAIMLVLIVLGSALFSSASDEGPVPAIGAANSQAVANMTADNALAEAGKAAPDEPLAELGVAPSATTAEASNAARIASQIPAEKQKDNSKAR